MNSEKVWPLYTGKLPWPRALTLKPRPPYHLLEGFYWEPPFRIASDEELSVPEGTAFGPFTYTEAQNFSDELSGDTTLCILTGNGVQAIMLKGLALQKAMESIDGQLPGMTFCPQDSGATLLIGFGKQFQDINTVDVYASCNPNTIFPIGRVWEKPVRHRRGENLRLDLPWKLPGMRTLEDLAPLANFLSGLNLTEKDQADFRAAESVQAAKDERARQENITYWESVATMKSTTRELLP